MDDRALEGRAGPQRSAFGVLTAVAMLVAGCGGEPSAPDPTVQRIEIEPAALTFNALGATADLSVRVLNPAGETLSVPIGWTSSSNGVARVDADGTVESVGNGSATITASSGGVRAEVLVEVAQTLERAEFEDLPPALLQGVPRTVVVRLLDPLGRLVEWAEGTLRLVAENGGFTLDGNPETQVRSGEAVFADLAFDGLGFDQRLIATFDNRTLLSPTFDLVSAFDRITAVGDTPLPVGFLLDGVAGGAFQNDLPFAPVDSIAEVGAFRGILPGEVVAFAPERAPLIHPVTWSDGPDSIEVELPEPVKVDLAVWIVKGPFAEQAAWAGEALERTRLIWAAERYGIEIDSVEVIDATQDSDASQFFDFSGCSERGNAQNRIGARAGRINIYYVERVDGGRDRGRTCPVGGTFVVMAERSGDELLAHELGHVFGLIHVDGLTESFDQSNVMHSASSRRAFLTEAQVFRTHFDNGSALNIGQPPGQRPVRPCPGLAGTPECPSIEVRIWADGVFAAPPRMAASLAAAHPLVRRWLHTDCMLEDNEGLDQSLVALRSQGVNDLFEVASDDSMPAGLRTKAVEGLGRFRTLGARSALHRLSAVSTEEVRAEAAFQLRGGN